MLIRTAGLPASWLDRLGFDWPGVLVSVEQAREQEGVAFREAAGLFSRSLALLPASPLRLAVYNAGKEFGAAKKLNESFVHRLQAGDAATRTLAEGLLRWLEARNQLEIQEGRLKGIYQDALSANYRLLQQAAGEPALRRALLFASHDLLTRLAPFRSRDLALPNKKDRQTALGILQYLTRAAAKTSPFSHFTTVSLHPLQAEAREDGDEFFLEKKTVITPNVALLPQVYDLLLREPAFYRALTVRLNPCITRLEPVEYGWLYFDGEQEALQRLPARPAATFVVETLLKKDRRMAFPELVERLAGAVEADAPALEAYVLNLLDIGLLEWIWPEPGLSAGWCGGLYQVLGFLPARPAVVEAAGLMQWLRQAARTLPYQPVEEARETQEASRTEIARFCERAGAAVPPLTPEQVFFEDVEAPVAHGLPSGLIEELVAALAGRWRQQPGSALAGPAAQAWRFVRDRFGPAGRLEFPDFCRHYFEEGGLNTAGAEAVSGPPLPPFRGRIGALLQVYREGQDWRAVVNGLFPGGGKLFARWLHLFPSSALEKLREWQSGSPLIPFPWQGWYNANFQPALPGRSLAVPGGRLPLLPGGKSLPLGDLQVVWDDAGIRLWDPVLERTVQFTDLGLEAPETRPASMRLLAHLGLPDVSRVMLLGWPRPAEGRGAHARFYGREEAGPLVLARAQWEVDPEHWPATWPTEDLTVFLLLRQKLADLGVPRRFFARHTGEKPQYFDQDSPVLMQLLARSLRQRGSMAVLLTEMLPLPEQGAIRSGSENRVGEVVVEFEV